MMCILMFTDGSISKNPGGLGAYSCIIQEKGKEEVILTGKEENSTNSRAELLPMLVGLQNTPVGSNVKIHSDSQYALNVCSGRYNARKNLDLVLAIRKEAEKRDVEWIWVKGHNGHKENERADRLAVEFRYKESGRFRVAFTGHRDRKADWWAIKDILDYYTEEYGVDGFTVVHGGAEGFDTQVSRVANKFCLQEEVIRPDYNRYGKSAPLKRNEEIIKHADIVFALYDGRTRGGTLHAINYAKKLKKEINFLNCVDK